MQRLIFRPIHGETDAKPFPRLEGGESVEALEIPFRVVAGFRPVAKADKPESDHTDKAFVNRNAAESTEIAAAGREV